MTLRDLMMEEDGEVSPLYDTSSGLSVADAAGRPDGPAFYEVLAVHRDGGYTWAAVRGPSGSLDVYGPDAGGMYRDALSEPGELAAWVEENFPG